MWRSRSSITGSLWLQPPVGALCAKSGRLPRQPGGTRWPRSGSCDRYVRLRGASLRSVLCRTSFSDVESSQCLRAGSTARHPLATMPLSHKFHATYHTRPAQAPHKTRSKRRNLGPSTSAAIPRPSVRGRLWRRCEPTQAYGLWLMAYGLWLMAYGYGLMRARA